MDKAVKKYIPILCLDKQEPHDNFAQAAHFFLTEIKKMMHDQKGMSYQVLETAMFIEVQDENGQTLGMFNFYDVKDFGYTIGLMRGEGELLEVTPEMIELGEASPDRSEFEKTPQQIGVAMFEDMMSMLQKAGF